MKLWYLTRLGASRLLDPAQDAPLERVFPARQPVSLEAFEGQGALLVTEGHIQVIRNDTRYGSVPTEIINPTEIIGATAASSQDTGAPLEQAVVMDECRGILLPRLLFELRLAAHPLPTRSTHYLAGLRMRRLECSIADLVFQPLEVRLARLLDHLRTRFSQEGKGPDAFPVRLAYWQMAHLLCCSRESVELTLEEWERQGWITWRRGQLMVPENRATARSDSVD